jgi:hypothetical protein
MINNKWYKGHIANIKQKAGARYTPELNVDLPISEIFEGISRTEGFYEKIRKQYGKLIREFKHITSLYDNSELQTAYNTIKKNFDSLIKLLDPIREYDTSPIPWEQINQFAKSIEDNFWTFSDQLRQARDNIKNTKDPSKDSSSHSSLYEKYGFDIHHGYETQRALRFFETLSSSTKAKLSNHPFLFLTGYAGNGKTHLLCDVVEHRLRDPLKPLPAFLVFGEYFSNGNDVYHQIIEQLGLTDACKTKDDFMKELDQLGINARSRSLLIIDALNENITYAPGFWKNNLDEVIEDIGKYPNIALIVSVRSGFEDEVLTDKQKDLFIHEEHHGFRFREWEAVRKFFHSFSLPLPEIPLLMPEFQNPLFLLLFCKAFKKRKGKKDKQIFRGHEGATYIFENYVDSVSKVIEKAFHIDSGPKKNIWDTIIEKIGEEMVNQSDERVSEEKVFEIIRQGHPHADVGKLLQALESNLLILKAPRYLRGERVAGFDIKFPFQKFSDHLIGRYIFKKYEHKFGKANKNLNTAKKYFSKRNRLGKFLSRAWNRGIIEALSIQCPEQLRGIEFIEVAPYLLKDEYLSQIATEAFVDSLIWRNPKAFSKDRKATFKIINQHVIKSDSGHNQLLNAFLSIAPIPNHPFNANFLHNHLSKETMATRDSWWSTFLHYQQGEQGAVDRLLDWSWSGHEKVHISDDSMFFTAIALSWFLTTSNRYVRDRATKGLVSVLQNRIYLIPKLLEAFKHVNDPYVAERLYAVAYGCVLRNSKDINHLETLAKWVYENIFKDNRPPVHILLRDYARGIIEISLRRKIKLSIDESNINPPYESDWPENIPSEEELRREYYPQDSSQNKTEAAGLFGIWYSLMYSYGGFPADFGNYVVSSHLSYWSGRKLKFPEPNRRKLLKAFREQLTGKQNELLEKATNPLFGIDLTEIYRYIKIVKFNTKTSLTDEEIKAQELAEEQKQKEAFVEFKASLSNTQLSYFEKEIEPFLDRRGSINDPFENFDIRLAQRWIFNRVITLGYNPKLHGDFDKDVSSHNRDRGVHKAERIGKKYQWIAYHEFTALVSDHFEFKAADWNDSIEIYKGPWRPYTRDIDPTLLIQSDAHIRETATFEQWKSTHGIYDAWEKEKSNEEWIKVQDDLPSPEHMIQITDDKQKEWLLLEGGFRWQEETPPEYERYDIPIRDLLFTLKSYIVKKKDIDKVYDWGKKQNFIGSWMPQSHDFYEIFLGEYPNSIAFENLRDDDIWVKSGRGDEHLEAPLVVMDDSYLNEFTLDCSHKGSISVKLPCKWLVNEMGLHHRCVDGRFYDKNEVKIFDTSIFEENFPSALLIDKKTLIDFCTKNGYAIYWTLLGEKQMIGGHISNEDYAGRLHISGAYYLNDKGQVEGEHQSKFNK